MLYLTRKDQEVIVIGTDIVIKVLGFDRRSGSVKLGITAPLHVVVDRAEVRQAKEAGPGVSPRQAADEASIEAKGGAR